MILVIRLSVEDWITALKWVWLSKHGIDLHRTIAVYKVTYRMHVSALHCMGYPAAVSGDQVMGYPAANGDQVVFV